MQTFKILSSGSQPDNKQSLVFPVRRRQFLSGMLALEQSNSSLDVERRQQRWQQNEPILLKSFLSGVSKEFSDQISQSKVLYESLLEGKELDELLSEEPYHSRLEPKFELLSARYDAADEQEICSIDFDTHDGDELIEDIWLRASWLSYEESDRSLRFRFSFGMEGYEDVSQDLHRQRLAAELEERIFPESAMLSQNAELSETLSQIIQSDSFELLERIVYYNAPNGGAQFHHDAEKGHVGVVYAQVSGKTFWLALSKLQLISEIQNFIAKDEKSATFLAEIQQKKLDESFIEKIQNKAFLDQALNDLFHPELELLLNFNKAFFSQLVEKGYAYYLEPGDIILLPQESMQNCAWHTVYCVGDSAGEALSFAIKRY